MANVCCQPRLAPDQRCQTARRDRRTDNRVSRPANRNCLSLPAPFSFPRRKLACRLVVPFVPCPRRHPDEGWMERRQTHSLTRVRLRRATTLSRGDRDLSRRSTVVGCGPTKLAPGSGTGARSDCPRQTVTAWRSGSGPPCGAVRAASAGRHSPLRLSGSSPETPLMSEDGQLIHQLRFVVNT